MRRALLLAAMAGLLLGGSAGAQDDQNLQMPEQQDLDQQAQQQPADTQQGANATDQQQTPQAAAPATPQQPAAQQPAAPTQQQPGVGGTGTQSEVICQCPSCPMNQGGVGGPGMMGGAPMPMAGALYGVRLGEISKITVDKTHGGASIHFEAKNSKDKDEVQTLANALSSQWQAAAFETKKVPEQQQPAGK